MDSSKFYTRKGDYGMTTLYTKKGETRVCKNHPVVDILGDIDYLTIKIGKISFELKNDFCDYENKELYDDTLAFLRRIQCILYQIGPSVGDPSLTLDTSEEVKTMERFIDIYSQYLPALIIPNVSLAEIAAQEARCLTRQVERKYVTYVEQQERIDYYNISYFNRLSDYLYILAHYIAVRYAGDADDSDSEWHVERLPYVCDVQDASDVY